jgi:ABC-type phosphate/phosphonate transport system permease subunit
MTLWAPEKNICTRGPNLVKCHQFSIVYQALIHLLDFLRKFIQTIVMAITGTNISILLGLN